MLEGQSVLITGGTGGLGIGVTQEALAQGASVIIPYVSAKEVERINSILSPAAKARTRFVETDVLQADRVAQLVSMIDRLDAVIHLVGGFVMGPTDQFSYEEWQQALNLNLNSTFLICKYALQKMLAQNYGRLVTIGSRGALEPAGNLAAYCAAKAAVVALTRAIADETKGKNITANVVLPSVIDTPANRTAMGEAHADQWVKPASLAKVICFLASPAAQDIRGAAVPVYGNI
jgi:NAD(P)-dependent dehydrogenase (short-subunit alcohol dehydrogenase family)